MALVVKDRVKETTTTTGTGTVTLAGASTGYQSFSVIGDGNTTYYTIVSGNNWEVGVGTYTASGTTLSRDTILESSNAGSKITLSGTSDVFCTYPAERSVNTAGATFTGTVDATRLGVSASAATLDLTSTSNIYSRINFGDAADSDIGQIYYDHPNNAMKFYTNNSERMAISSAGVVDIGGNVVLDASDIGSTVQAYDADTAKYDDTTANFTGTLQNGGSNVVVDTDIGSTVQGYDAGLAYLDGLNFTDEATFKAGVNLEIGTDVQAYDVDTLKADTADTLTAPFRGTVTTDNDLSFDQNVTNNFSCTPTSGAALTFTNHTSGQSGYVLLDNSAGVAITAAATTKITATDLTTISTAGVYLISYFDNGTNAYVTVSASYS